ncbi:MAG: hypothetical protein P8P29_06760 [Flavobacteriaceae bacterium]|nr:hypothetical protein [Flavobacteriaceae bacterium]
MNNNVNAIKPVVQKSKIYLFDIESFYDYFCVVFKPPNGDTKSHIIFEVSTFKNDSKSLYEFLLTKPKLIGYNSLGYDSQILERFVDLKGNMTGKEIFKFSQEEIINSERPPYSKWKIQHTDNLDLMAMHGYGRGPRACSVKWLEFTLRMKRIKDLPVDFRKPVTSRSTADDINKYCKFDVDATEVIYNISKDLIKRRTAISKANGGEKFYNIADQNIGEDLMLKAMAIKLNVKEYELRKMRTLRPNISIRDVILPYVKFKSPEFNKILDFYKDTIVHAEEDNKVVLKGKVSISTMFNGIKVDFGAGGVHSSRMGIHRATDTETILSIDVASYYPNLAISNGFYPKHLGIDFCKVYHDKYVERTTYPKSNPMNAAIKLMLNSAFGKSGSIYSFLFDPSFLLSITINGQLLLAMLAEKLAANGAKLIAINTDGLELICKKGKEHVYRKICRQWEKLTGLVLEEETYKMMAISDVNNYLAIYENGKIKRKGKFETYEDIVNSGNLFKNTSAGVVAKAVNEYFVNQIPIEDTIENETDIYEFLYGKKKTSAFIHEVAKADDQGRVSGKLYSDRVLRFYMSTDGGSLRKLWKDFRITSINKEGLVTPLQYVRSPLAVRYTNLNKSWYVSEAYKIIDSIEGSEFI